MTYGSDGYPIGWQNEAPGPYALGDFIWRDSWGPPPPLVYVGNGTNTPGPLIPHQWQQETIEAYNAGVGALPPPLELTSMFPVYVPPPPPPPPLDPTALDWFPTKQNPPVGASEMASTNPFFNNPVFQNQRTTLLNAGGMYQPVYSRTADVVNAASGVCDALPPGYKQACQAAAAVARAAVGGGSSSSSNALTTECPAGYTWNATLGRCIAPQNALPGGQPLTLTRNQATTGGLGITAVTPIQVGTIMRNDGSTGPILRCPPRFVLGQDYMCYPKSMIPNQLRAHPRGTRPLLTGGEVKILRRAKTLEKKVSKLGRQFGHKKCSCSTRSSSRKKK